ncbi:adenosylcobinamide-phosphate synthase CbiB [Paracoccaceae bacterium GXU_MW_L88]
MTFAAMMLIACLIDAALGWPPALHRRIGHPVTWLGALISGLERRVNRGLPALRFGCGLAVTLLTIAAAMLPALLLQTLLPQALFGILLGGLLAWPLIALRSLHTHVAAVAPPLAAGDLAGAQRAVSQIVGRDPSTLDEDGVARAALESLAENASDGVVAPVFWGCLFGLPGIAAYKAINTLDSMIGHRNDRYADFGKAAARIDDAANLIPARLTGLGFALAGKTPRTALRGMWQDAPRHRSPNAGWPEAAMAYALGLRLSGPRVYGSKIATEPWLNPEAPDPDANGIRAGLALYRRTMIGFGALLAALAVLA